MKKIIAIALAAAMLTAFPFSVSAAETGGGDSNPSSYSDKTGGVSLRSENDPTAEPTTAPAEPATAEPTTAPAEPTTAEPTTEPVEPTTEAADETGLTINLSDLTVTGAGEASMLPEYSYADFNTFKAAFESGSLPKAYVTDFLFDGIDKVKKYSLNSETNSAKVTEFDICVVNINTTGDVEFTGTATNTMIAINTNGITGNVNLTLNAVDLTSNKFVPAVYAYNSDVTYTGCNVTINPKAGTENKLTGGTIKKVSTMASDSLSGTYAEAESYYGVYSATQLENLLFASDKADAEKLAEGAPSTYYKSSGAVSSDIALTFAGEGALTITSLNDEGVETKGDLKFTGGTGDYTVISMDDGLNASTSGTDIYINVNSLLVQVSDEAEEGDGIDSNGTIHIEGGKVTAMAYAESQDAGIDSDNGTYINGGEVIGTGNMADKVEDTSAQHFIYLQFAAQQAADTTVSVTDTSGNKVVSYTSPRTFTNIVMSCPALKEGTYYVYCNDVQQCYSSVGSQGGFDPGQGGNPPEGGQGDNPPEGGQGSNPPEPPEGGQGGFDPGQDGQGSNPPEPPEGGQGGFDPGQGGNPPEGDQGQQVVSGDGETKFVITDSQHTFIGVTTYTGSGEDKPEAEVIAAWDFDNTDKAEGDKLKEYGNADDGYAATTGSGTLTVSVTGAANRALEWSKPEYGENADGIVPIMAAGSKNLWGSPFIEFTVDASDYSDLALTAYFGGSNKAPATWQLSYSTDGETFTDIDGAVFTISQETKKILTAYFDAQSIPEGASNAKTLTLRLTPTSMATVEGGNTSDKPSGGEIALNNIKITGIKAKTQDDPTPVKIGDVNNDGQVNGADAGILARYASGWQGYSDMIKNMAAADINGDNQVNGADAGILARYASGWTQYAHYFE